MEAHRHEAARHMIEPVGVSCWRHRLQADDMPILILEALPLLNPDLDATGRCQSAQRVRHAGTVDQEQASWPGWKLVAGRLWREVHVAFIPKADVVVWQREILPLPGMPGQLTACLIVFVDRTLS